MQGDDGIRKRESWPPQASAKNIPGSKKEEGFLRWWSPAQILAYFSSQTRSAPSTTGPLLVALSLPQKQSLPTAPPPPPI